MKHLKKLLAYFAANYRLIFKTIFGNMRDNRTFNDLYLAIKDANKRFLKHGKRHYVIPDPYKKGRFFSASRHELYFIFKRRLNIHKLLEISVYVTPERLTDAAIQELKASKIEDIIKGIRRKVKL